VPGAAKSGDGGTGKGNLQNGSRRHRQSWAGFLWPLRKMAAGLGEGVGQGLRGSEDGLGGGTAAPSFQAGRGGKESRFPVRQPVRAGLLAWPPC